MENKRSEKGVRELFAASLKNVKEGDRILSYMEKLIAERDTLEERQQHLKSLTRLFEKTVSNADELAAQIRQEAEEKAKNEAEAILGQADEKVQKILEEKRLEMVETIEAETRESREKSARALELKLKEKKAALQSLFKNYSERLYNEMLVQTENFKQQIELFEIDIEKNLSDICELSNPGTTPEAGQNTSADNLQVISGTSEEDLTLQQLINDEMKQDDTASNIAETGMERMELEILPPRDKDAMEAIEVYLSGLTEVSAVDLRHLTDKTVIEIILNSKIDIIQAISKLSQVEQIQEVVVGGEKKIQIFLTARSELEKAKDVLNTRANRITSRRV